MEFIKESIIRKSQIKNADVQVFFQNVFKQQRVDSIFKFLDQFFSNWIDDLWIYLEYPYVDKLYRSSYYEYFSSKHKTLNRNCVRLAFFNSQIDYADFYDHTKHEDIQSTFLGYLVIRPTLPRCIGRNLLSPKILKSNGFECCLVRDNIEIKGLKLNIDGFPHESQDAEFSTCAETSIWSLVEYYSHKYPEYKPLLLSDITRNVNEKSCNRTLPSFGLDYQQISFVLKNAGLAPIIYNLDNFPPNFDFKTTLFTYINSGIPLIGGLTFKDENGHSKEKNIGHAIVIIGKNEIDKEHLKRNISKLDPDFYDINVYDNSSLVIMDDNKHPYVVEPFNNPTRSYENSFIDAILVPLYPKIHIDAFKAKTIIDKFLELYSSDIQKKIKETPLSYPWLYRLMLTSSRSFKSFICKNPSLDINIKHILSSIAMPKFIWVTELFDINLLDSNKVNGFIILDATASYFNEDELIDSFLFILINGKFSCNLFNWTDIGFTGKMDCYKNNLKGRWNEWRAL